MISAAYMSWKVLQFKLLEARRDRKLGETAGRNGRSLTLNHSKMMEGLLRLAVLKLSRRSSCTVSRITDTAGLRGSSIYNKAESKSSSVLLCH